MMKIPFYQVDAFSRKIFGGNPAAVCPLESWPADEILQNIAAENNLSETAFFVQRSKGRYKLRWFTPTVEVDLCGHATLASAFIIFSFVDRSLTSVDFETASGPLSVAKSGELLSLNFPARKPVPAEASPILSQALGTEPLEVLKARDLLAVFKDESTIKNMIPDFDKLKQIREILGIIVTAPVRSRILCRDFSRRTPASLKIRLQAHRIARLFHIGPIVSRKTNCTLFNYRSVAVNCSVRMWEIVCEFQGMRLSMPKENCIYSSLSKRSRGPRQQAASISFAIGQLY